MQSCNNTLRLWCLSVHPNSSPRQVFGEGKGAHCGHVTCQYFWGVGYWGGGGTVSCFMYICDSMFSVYTVLLLLFLQL